MTTRKGVLNATSRKKRDTMLNYTNISPNTPVGGSSYAAGPSRFPGDYSTTIDNSPMTVVWTATARDVTRATGGSAGTVYTTSTRTAQTCYMVGLKETVEIQINNGVPWQWRRVCFTAKGFHTFLNFTPGTSLETSNGYARASSILDGTKSTGSLGRLYDVLLRGVASVDWHDPMVAATDNQRVSIKYDVTRTLSAGNESGKIQKFNLWHAMGKNLRYDEDENGGDESGSKWSTLGKPGMGDYYVVDMFRPRYAALNSDNLWSNPSATLYWHER